MIEHVRRRALISGSITNVYVATCDKEIAGLVKEHGGDVIMTDNSHLTGTSRTAEAISKLIVHMCSFYKVMNHYYFRDTLIVW